MTDEGIEGISTTGSGAVAIDLVDRRLRELLIGKDPMMKEQIWHDLWEVDRIEELPLYMMGVIDVALWDITSKVAGLPLYQVIGGYSVKVPAYASTVTYESIDEYLRIADQCLDRGFRAIKLHAWGDHKEDAKLAKALRKHVGDDIDLMYDGSAGFDLHQAIWLGRQLEDAGFRWYEEPMREFNIRAYSQLCTALTIPVLAAETSDGCHYNVADFIHNGAADLVRTGVYYKGGITGSLRIAHMADSFGIKAEIHGGGLANLHLACAIPNNSYYEIIVAGDPIFFEDEVDSDGFVTVSDKPGIGFEFDWRELQTMAFLTT
jgi:L-alanine-DL-glutamate epimerase-like enolase superfamily enzyme